MENPIYKWMITRGTSKNPGHSHIPYLVGGLEHVFYEFPIILGTSSQLTFTPSFFRGVDIPPTRYLRGW